MKKKYSDKEIIKAVTAIRRRNNKTEWNKIREARKNNRNVFKSMMSFLHKKYPSKFKTATLVKGDVLTDMLEFLQKNHTDEFTRFFEQIKKNDEKVNKWMNRI